jgi:sugar/nucleoside kinase (ribokinase family)
MCDDAIHAETGRAPEVISMGNLLVEVMRINLDEPLGLVGGTFAGPFPSGDPAIYIDTVARLGHRAGYLGAVGQDDFGRCILERFARDGVDFSHGRVLADRTTGVAFVAYFRDGSRRFIFHWRDAASGQLDPAQVQAAYFQNARWLHLTGSTLAINESCRAAAYRALDALPAGARISFDPNIRPEVLTVEQIRDLCRPVLDRADVFLPSAGEALMFTGAISDEEGCRALAATGKLVVLKQGVRGCTVFEQESEVVVPGFVVPEVDPTGGGDCFCAGFTAGLLEGLRPPEAARFANAVGALAVTKRGPMEGAPARQEVLALLAAQGGGAPGDRANP